MDTFFTTAGMGPVQILMMAVPIVVIVGLIAGTVVVNLRRWHKNNTAPQQELKARVAEKRTSAAAMRARSSPRAMPAGTTPPLKWKTETRWSWS